MGSWFTLYNYDDRISVSHITKYKMISNEIEYLSAARVDSNADTQECVNRLF